MKRKSCLRLCEETGRMSSSQWETAPPTASTTVGGSPLLSSPTTDTADANRDQGLSSTSKLSLGSFEIHSPSHDDSLSFYHDYSASSSSDLCVLSSLLDLLKKGTVEDPSGPSPTFYPVSYCSSVYAVLFCSRESSIGPQSLSGIQPHRRHVAIPSRLRGPSDCRRPFGVLHVNAVLPSLFSKAVLQPAHVSLDSIRAVFHQSFERSSLFSLWVFRSLLRLFVLSLPVVFLAFLWSGALR